MRSPEINVRPQLTKAEVEALKVGDKVRDITDRLWHIRAIIDAGEEHPRLYVLATWSYRRQSWLYEVAEVWVMPLKYTAE